MPNFGEQFLHQKDSKLHTSKAVEHEKQRKEIKGEETSQKPADKLADFMAVLEHTHTGHRDDPRVAERIKASYHKEHIIEAENIPESYFANQQRLAREQGHGDIEITESMREQLSEVIIADQESTLDKWLDYFTSEDSDSYPMWAKYWAFTNMTKLSSFDKEKHSFAKRDKGTVAPFPDLNREALAYVVDAIIKKVAKDNLPKEEKKKLAQEIQDPEFQKVLDTESFAKLYAWAIEKVTPTEQNELINTEGEWVKYDRNSDHMPLVESLQGYGTGWCIAGESTAENYLSLGDHYIYYSYDKDGKPTIPRVTIRLQEDSIAEVRGIAYEQNLDPYISDVVKDKLAEFPDGKAYEQKSADMKLLTEIDNKTKAGEKLNKDELIFLYEIDQSIEGFGYQRDPRIEEIRQSRNPKEDAPIVFDCQPNEIAYSQKEITENTKAYIGPLFPSIFEIKLENIYTSFPEGRIKELGLIIGDKHKDQLEAELKEKYRVNSYTQTILDKAKIITLEKAENMELVVLTVADLGSLKDDTTEQIYQKAQELGLDLCPAEVGPQLRLQYDQPKGEYLLVAMEPITAADGYPKVFFVNRSHDGDRWLDSRSAGPEFGWSAGGRWVFARRK